MSKILKIIAVLIAVSGLIAIRFFEANFFYDPLLTFFKTNHTTQELPEMQSFKMLSAVAGRFLLNATLSLVILWFLFGKYSVIKFSAALYLILGAILLLILAMLINYDTQAPHTAIFYVRRFLIQPIFLLILVPAFYIQNRN